MNFKFWTWFRCRRCEEGDLCIRIMTEELIHLKKESEGRLREARRWKQLEKVMKTIAKLRGLEIENLKSESEAWERRAVLLQRQVFELRKNIYRIKTEKAGKS